MEYTFQPTRRGPSHRRRGVTISTSTTTTASRPRLVHHTPATGSTIDTTRASPSSYTSISDAGSSTSSTNPFDTVDEATRQSATTTRTTAATAPANPLPPRGQQELQTFEVQELDPSDTQETFDLSPPLQISGHGQLLLWQGCIVHIYHSDDDTTPGEQLPLGDGKGIVPHGVSVWLAGRHGMVKTRDALSP
ncbi:uncharacterized protein B0I36DRAFT_165794 [Microdochium trichocladiopsis]|uniref:Uncharacterized protein n=1 Tax=Microdochium trichocladiopsis TaxID=1682393 RepID=A0A9P9BM30_9PEZI|nr:uncharacterized protein B0I36DRAFT_165794 [Microdochium trichocladiopsis]KAH7025045.1 hypothetical protein B0I36DRAFT_165794 [Microdochium trichocladiopsis]